MNILCLFSLLGTKLPGDLISLQHDLIPKSYVKHVFAETVCAKSCPLLRVEHNHKENIQSVFIVQCLFSYNTFSRKHRDELRRPCDLPKVKDRMLVRKGKQIKLSFRSTTVAGKGGKVPGARV